jgi:3-oxoacyl-[acyl-carrier-protein] synthase-3
MLKARISGTGSYLPEKTLTNSDLAGMVDTTDEWISSRTGIKERRVCTGETNTDMAVRAAKAALKSSGVSAKEIDLVIVGTVTSDMTFPSTACFVQSALGIKPGVAAFDISAACSGFLYALDVAEKYIKAGSATRALVIGVDRFSSIIDWSDRATCVLFGDGAGAVVLNSGRGQRGILSSRIHSDGRKWEMLYAPGAGAKSPFGKKAASTPYLKMQGNETFKVAVRTMESVMGEVLESNGMAPGDIALLIPHQANRRIINAMQKRLGLSDERVFMNLERYGNTSAASIPIALDEAVRGGRIKSGDIILFVAFGGGLTWAATLIRW